jgi:tetratricopeptide (TPR) repeat protein
VNENYVCPGCGGVAELREERCAYCGNPFVAVLKSGEAVAADEATLLKRSVELETRLLRNPNEGKSHYELGQVYHRLGQYVKAQERLKLAVALDPRKTDWLYLLAWNTGIMQGWECAGVETCAKTALSVDPKFKPAEALLHLYRGAQAALYDRSDTAQETALEEFRAAIELDPKNAYGFYYAGCVYERLGDLEEAADYFRKAAVLSTQDFAPSKEDARLYARVGAIYCQLDRPEDAKKYLTEALTLDPENAGAKRMLSLIKD